MIDGGVMLGRSQPGPSRHFGDMGNDMQISADALSATASHSVDPEVPLELTPEGREILEWARSSSGNEDDARSGG
ncbi:MAG: hypothetical protein JWM71_592 [Solirubrobacteraceae bacterium]|nr:hypothetical protein [Solirubrobacteraceae bacterium]